MHSPTPSHTGTLLSLQTGRIQTRTLPDGLRTDFRHPNWTSAIFKSPITGPVHVGPLHITGDEQADLKHHGGPDNVVLAYSADHYPAWREKLAAPQLPFGAFGENFTVDGFTDDSVCIGDIWAVGPALRLQITQARQPCYKLARRLEQPHIVKMVMDACNGGWYLRVLTPGPAEAGMPITLESRLHPHWPASRAVRTMYSRKKNPDDARQLASLPELSARWKSELLETD